MHKGSMPERRKCLDYIGETRWGEAARVMRSKRECAANQLLVEDVNGSRLSPEELVVLQGCPARLPGSG